MSESIDSAVFGDSACGLPRQIEHIKAGVTNVQTPFALEMPDGEVVTFGNATPLCANMT